MWNQFVPTGKPQKEESLSDITPGKKVRDKLKAYNNGNIIERETLA